MVMKRNAMAKNLRQSILKSLGRYLAIAAIIALGGSMFVGLVTTKTDMVATGQKYMDTQNMFDLRLMSSYGWSEDQPEQIAAMEGVENAEGLKCLDVIATRGESTQESVYRFYSVPKNINRIVLRGGRMPESPDECLADGYHSTDAVLGTTIHVAESNSESTLDAMAYKTYTVVGYVYTPLYMDMNRGTTSVGNGSIASYLFIPEEGFDLDYYTEIHVTLPGDFPVYTDAYNTAMEEAAEDLEPLLKPLAQQRLEQVKNDAEQAYREGLSEYKKGLADYQEGERTAQKELADAHQELLDGERELKDNEQLIADGEVQLADAEQTMKNGEKMPMKYSFYNHFDLSFIEEITGIKLSEE